MALPFSWRCEMHCVISPPPSTWHSHPSLLRSCGSMGTSTCTASVPRYAWGEANRTSLMNLHRLAFLSSPTTAQKTQKYFRRLNISQNTKTEQKKSHDTTYISHNTFQITEEMGQFLLWVDRIPVPVLLCFVKCCCILTLRATVFMNILTITLQIWLMG